VVVSDWMMWIASFSWAAAKVRFADTKYGLSPLQYFESRHRCAYI